jgi:hypothetical protein
VATQQRVSGIAITAALMQTLDRLAEELEIAPLRTN